VRLKTQFLNGLISVAAGGQRVAAWATKRRPPSLGQTSRTKSATGYHGSMTSGACIRIMNGERSISAQMAIRLGQAFGTTAHYWLNLQATHDLKQARAKMPAEALHIVSYAAAGPPGVARATSPDRHRIFRCSDCDGARSQGRSQPAWG
jgi:plasmid maintenance system antidote protein VapI